MLGKISLTLLLLGVVFAAGPYKNTTDFWTKQLNRTSLGYEAYSGYEEIDWYYKPGESGMFYQFFAARSINPRKENPNIPVIIWLQGGPGASSQYGCFTELGPIKIENNTAVPRGYGWNIFGHLVFIDSPLNVGFSYAPGNRTGVQQVNSTDMATNHLQNFLVNFYDTWSELRASPLYITGESFAGHYVPNLAKKLISNQTRLKFKVGGVMIGDGWTDPINQINYYDTYLWSVGVIDRGFRDTCTWFQTNSIMNIYEFNYQKATDYFDFITNNDTTPREYMGGISIFNFRHYDDEDETFAKFLQNNKATFGVRPDIAYIPGNDNIYTAFGADVTRSYAADVVNVIRSVPTLIYNGQDDVVVNTPGVLQYLNSLQWEMINYWKRSPKTVWKIAGEVVGWTKVYGNLWFAVVNGAGHMVPADQPQRAFVLVGHFLNNEREWDQ